MKSSTREDSGHAAAKPGVIRHPSLRTHIGEANGAGGVRIGIVENFHIGNYDHVEGVLRDLRALNVTDLRTIVSWADWETAEGEAWYRWLLPRLARRANVIPFVL